jgi:hypothetical protein
MRSSRAQSSWRHRWRPPSPHVSFPASSQSMDRRDPHTTHFLVCSSPPISSNPQRNPLCLPIHLTLCLCSRICLFRQPPTLNHQTILLCPWLLHLMIFLVGHLDQCIAQCCSATCCNLCDFSTPSIWSCCFCTIRSCR